jgi:hypothetical protein
VHVLQFSSVKEGPCNMRVLLMKGRSQCKKKRVLPVHGTNQVCSHDEYCLFMRLMLLFVYMTNVCLHSGCLFTWPMLI